MTIFLKILQLTNLLAHLYVEIGIFYLYWIDAYEMSDVMKIGAKMKLLQLMFLVYFSFLILELHVNIFY